MGSKALFSGRLDTAVANAGTYVVSAYPTGSTQASLTGSTGGGVAISNNDYWPQGSGAGTVSFTFGASTITITNNSGVTWAAGSTIIASFGRTDRNGSYNLVIGTTADTAKAGNL
jgi:hypothetical protein